MMRVLPCAPFSDIPGVMVSWFRRKKPDAPANPVDSLPLDTPVPAPSELQIGSSVVHADAPGFNQDDLDRNGLEGATPVPVANDLATDPEAAAPASPGKPGWRERLRGSGFARSLGGLFSRNPKLDDDLIDEIETTLLTA